MTEQQFTLLIEKYQHLVYSICFQMVGDSQQAQDLTQETFVSVWIHRGNMVSGKEKSWICRIACNKSKDYLKSAFVRKTTIYEKDHLDQFFSMQGLPQQDTEQNQLYQNICQHISALPEPYSSICNAAFLKGLSPKEIAFSFGRPLATVQTQLYRGKKLLQSNLSSTLKAVV